MTQRPPIRWSDISSLRIFKWERIGKVAIYYLQSLSLIVAMIAVLLCVIFGNEMGAQTMLLLIIAIRLTHERDET